MRRTRLVALATASLIGAAVTLPLTTAQAVATSAGASAARGDAADHVKVGSDSLTQPWQRAFAERHQAALEKSLRSGATGSSVKVGKGAYGRVAQTGKDRIFVVLAEFGRTAHSAYPDGGSDATRVDGPRHNQIPQPDRTTDNSTNWQQDYDRSHYQNMYFNRMASFYSQESHGKYTVGGQVADWVRVPFNEARYGRNTCGSITCSNTWFLIRDALAEWTQMKLDDGWSMTRIQDYLKTFDKQDRYDFDGDGDFNEPDGYIDHFQIVHAGGDEADGDPVYGEDAIWSHRWYAQIEPFGTGPADGGQFGGVNVGEGGLSDPNGAKVQIPDNPTGVWVGDYTIQPENGGLSVFSHEFGHDLGLPDLYDTSGNTGGASNSVEFWSLMSQSRGTAPGDSGIGDRPMPFGAWEKFQLGWLDYDVARAGQSSTHVIRPGQSTSGTASNGLVVLLPNKQVTTQLGEPCATCGQKYYFSGAGNDLNNTMTREVADGGPLTAKVRYEIEDGFDYAYLEASSDGGQTWASLPTSQSYTGEDQSGAGDGTGISGTTNGEWVDLTADVPAGTNALRWRYATDGGLALAGFQVDNITLAGTDIGTAETGDEGWTLDGFKATNGTETNSFLNAYFVDNRQYVGRDTLLKHLYNFRDAAHDPNKVEFFHFSPGALISYWDTSYNDNNVGDHPGGGQVLPVDAHTMLNHYPDGSIARTRANTADSTFSLKASPAQTLHINGAAYTLARQSAMPLFDDMKNWWFDNDEHGGSPHVGFYQPGWFGVDVPKTGTTIRVVKVADNGTMTLRVGTSS
ncbi:MAG: immune inhibitor A domain-containing protein [Nocardioides sp.]